MFERKEHQKGKDTLSNHKLGNEVVIALAWAASSDLDDEKLRADLRRRNPDLNLYLRQIVVQAIVDLTKEGGYISIGEGMYGKGVPLVDSGQVAIGNEVLYGMVFNLSHPDCNSKGIARHHSEMVRVAIDVYTNIKIALMNEKLVVVQRNVAGDFSRRYLSENP